jgi:integrase
MAKIRRGTEVEKDGRWYGRVRYTLPSGKRKDIWMPARNKTHAAQLVREKLDELKITGETDINTDRVTFDQLADKYKKSKIFPARIVNGRKVAGLKSYTTTLRAWQTLKEHFGKQRIKTITHSDIAAFKLLRLDTPTRSDGQRQISSVNRELELLRAMLRFAIREGWIMRTPFAMGDALIDKASETRRERVLTHGEEKRLLETCEMVSKDNRQRWLHLRPLLVAALDTGARRGELFKLQWKHVDLRARIITIVAENCKTARERKVGITPRLHDELMRLWNASAKDGEALVFGICNTIKSAWRRIRKEAGLEDFRWHDGRHTGVTRMVATRQPAAFIQKVSGHTQAVTFQRYVNPGVEAVTEIADALAELNTIASAKVEGQTAIVSEAVN